MERLKGPAAINGPITTPLRFVLIGPGWNARVRETARPFQVFPRISGKFPAAFHTTFLLPNQSTEFLEVSHQADPLRTS
jgi:hypothetical protein